MILLEEIFCLIGDFCKPKWGLYKSYRELIFKIIISTNFSHTPQLLSVEFGHEAVPHLQLPLVFHAG